MRKTIILAALAAFTSVPTAVQAQAVPAASVVIVDSERIFRECNACRTAQTSLQSQVTALQTRQRTLEGQLRPEGAAIQQAFNALNGAQPDQALRTRVEAFQKKQNDAQQELSRGQQNLQSIQANVVRQIEVRLRPAINQVMTARSANVAVDVSSTLAHSQGLNVTTDVLVALNRTLPSVTLTPLPQQQQPQRPQPQGR